MATSDAFPVISTGSIALANWLSGWYFTETGGTNSITVTIRKDSGAGTIIEQLTISAGKSVGEDYATWISGITAIHVTVAGTGTCQGHVRGR